MPNLKSDHWAIALSVLLAGGLGESPARASPICTQGEICESLQETVSRIKDLKRQRHQDVLQHGRPSEEVRADDEKIQAASAEDRRLRSERRSQLQASAQRHARSFRSVRSFLRRKNRV